MKNKRLFTPSYVGCLVLVDSEALLLDPDLSLHCVTFDPDSTKADESAASSHKPQPGIFRGPKDCDPSTIRVGNGSVERVCDNFMGNE